MSRVYASTAVSIGLSSVCFFRVATFFSFLNPALPRQPKPGEEVWRLRDSDTGRVRSCELRDHSRAGAGWEVQIIGAGEILVSRRCENEREARYVAEAARKDSLRTGSTAVERDGG